jgi:hypothetical protein
MALFRELGVCSFDPSNLAARGGKKLETLPTAIIDEALARLALIFE